MKSEIYGISELKSLIEGLEQEAAGIQIQGRALSENELERVRQIGVAVPSLREALSALSG